MSIRQKLTVVVVSPVELRLTHVSTLPSHLSVPGVPAPRVRLIDPTDDVDEGLCVIVSHSRKIIILGNRKCGSTSIHRYLGQLNEMPQDEFAFTDESTRFVTHYNGEELPATLRRLMSNTVPRHWTGYQAQALFGHIGLDWESYRKVVVIRNPWDRMVSNFMWQLKSRAPEGTDPMTIKFTGAQAMERFLLAHRDIYSNALPWFTGVVDGEYANHGFDVIRLEDFPEDLPKLWTSMTNDPVPDRVRFLNKTKHPNYIDCYTDLARDWVAKAFAEDISVGGYQFGMSSARATMRNWIAENIPGR